MGTISNKEFSAHPKGKKKKGVIGTMKLDQIIGNRLHFRNETTGATFEMPVDNPGDYTAGNEYDIIKNVG